MASSPCARSRGCGRSASTSATRRCARAAGAMSNMRGEITLTPRLPGAGDVFRSIFTSEARVRPFYTGTGSILLQPSLGGYHVLDVAEGEGWILEPGVYWASEGGVELGLYREPFWPSLWAGDGLLVWKTTVSGHGRVAINAPGPVETVDVGGRRAARAGAAGARPHRRASGSRRSARRRSRATSSPASGGCGSIAGTGKALVCWTPYWNEHLYKLMTGDEHRGLALRVAAAAVDSRARRRASGARHRAGERVAGEAFIEVEHGPGGAPARFARPRAGDRRAGARRRCRRRSPRSTRALGRRRLGRGLRQLRARLRLRAAAGAAAAGRAAAAAARLRGVPTRRGRRSRRRPAGALGPFRPRWDLGRATRAAFERVADYIRAGDIYQANLTLPLRRALARRPGGDPGGAGGAPAGRASGRWWRCRGRRCCRARRSSSSRSTARAGSRRGR